MNEKKSTIFIVQNDEDNEVFAAYQADVDLAIKNAENANRDIDFKVIGKINEPIGPKSLPLDFNENLIQWYEDTEKSKDFIKQVVVAIVNLITYKNG